MEIDEIDLADFNYLVARDTEIGYEFHTDEGIGRYVELPTNLCATRIYNIRFRG